jgi:hypothetical protein
MDKYTRHLFFNVSNHDRDLLVLRHKVSVHVHQNVSDHDLGPRDPRDSKGPPARDPMFVIWMEEKSPFQVVVCFPAWYPSPF